MKRKMMALKLFLLLIYFTFAILIPCDIVDAKMQPITRTKLTLENEPKIGGIAILKLSIIASENIDLEKTNIGCYIPLGLELIDDMKYEISGDISRDAQEIWGNLIILYKGPMKKGEKKEFIFKVRIPDEKKYLISVYGSGGQVELDLGDPEPPEWQPQAQQDTKIIAGREHIITDIKQIKGQSASELTIPKEELPPLRTELRIRTKDMPDLGAEYSANPKGPIPFRHLVYVENESPLVEVNCILPEGFEIADGSEYKTSQDPEGNTRVLLYSAAMRFKESKAIYFQVKLAKPLNIGERETITKTIHVETKLLTQENETLTKTDSRSISFGRILY